MKGTCPSPQSASRCTCTARLSRGRRGTTTVEYALVLTVIVVCCYVSFASLGLSVSGSAADTAAIAQPDQMAAVEQDRQDSEERSRGSRGANSREDWGRHRGWERGQRRGHR